MFGAPSTRILLQKLTSDFWWNGPASRSDSTPKMMRRMTVMLLELSVRLQPLDHAAGVGEQRRSNRHKLALRDTRA